VYSSNPARLEESYQEVARKISMPGWDDSKVDRLQLVYDLTMQIISQCFIEVRQL
jgi:hypothetical protein